MATNKCAFTIAEQIAQLKERGMNFRDEVQAAHFLENIRYYRLEGYWWDFQADKEEHIFYDNIWFEDIVVFYNFEGICD